MASLTCLPPQPVPLFLDVQGAPVSLKGYSYPEPQSRILPGNEIFAGVTVGRERSLIP